MRLVGIGQIMVTDEVSLIGQVVMDEVGWDWPDDGHE